MKNIIFSVIVLIFLLAGNLFASSPQLILSDNFNIANPPSNDQNAELSTRQAGSLAPNLWEDWGNIGGDTQPGGPYEAYVTINELNQLMLTHEPDSADLDDPDGIDWTNLIVPAQTSLTQMPCYQLKWDQGTFSEDSGSSWSFLRFNVTEPDIFGHVTSLNPAGNPDCGILVWNDTDLIQLWIDGVRAGHEGTFSNPSGENGLHHFEVDVCDGIMAVYVDSTIDSGSPTWTVDVSNVANGKNGIGIVAFYALASSTDVYAFLDNFEYSILPPAQCGDPGTEFLLGDITGPDGVPDCYVDLMDLELLFSKWLDCTDPADESCIHWWK